MDGEKPINKEEQTSEWEFVMFDSTTGVTHDIVCHCCRKPKRQFYNNYCAYCGAKMKGGAE